MTAPGTADPGMHVSIPERLREIAERDLYDPRTDAPCEPAYSDLHDIADRLEADRRPIRVGDPEPAVGSIIAAGLRVYVHITPTAWIVVPTTTGRTYPISWKIIAGDIADAGGGVLLRYGGAQ